MDHDESFRRNTMTYDPSWIRLRGCEETMFRYEGERLVAIVRRFPDGRRMTCVMDGLPEPCILGLNYKYDVETPHERVDGSSGRSAGPPPRSPHAGSSVRTTYVYDIENRHEPVDGSSGPSAGPPPPSPHAGSSVRTTYVYDAETGDLKRIERPDPNAPGSPGPA